MVQPSGQRRPLHRRFGCGGCLLLIVLLLVLGVAVVYGVTLVTSPWAIHIGGSATPLLHWDGYGEGVTPAGTHVAVALSLGPRQPSGGRHSSPCFSCGNLSGSGELCTANSDISFRSLGGNLHAYLSTEGSKMTVQLYRTASAAGSFELDMQGTWHGNTYSATDQNQLYEHFTPDGHFHASYTAVTTPQVTTLQINKGSHSAFKAACHALTAG